MERNKIKKEEFEQLFENGKTNKEISEKLNVTIDQVKYYIRSKGYHRVDPIEGVSLSENQEQMILGSLLGDLNIRLDTSNRSKNARIYIVHCEAQQGLFLEKVSILDQFMGSYKLYDKTKDKRTGKVYKTFRGNSKAHENFTEIYNLIYINGKKCITKEFLEKIHHPIALAYWFMDDGTNRGTLATNSFSELEITLLLDFLENKFGIIATRQKNSGNEVIYISANSRLKFEELIFPYMVPEMYYKLMYLEKLAKSV